LPEVKLDLILKDISSYINWNLKIMDDQLLYMQIYNYLLEGILSGSFGAGARLPSENELCDKFKVSRITSKRALELLAEQGFISRRPGKGSYVIGARDRRNKDLSSSRTIGFIIPDFSDSFGTRVISSVEESCAAHGYQLVLKQTRDHEEEEKRAIHSLSGAAGILLVPIHGEIYNSEILKLIYNKRPVVFVDRKLRGLAAPTVSSNNLEAAEAGVEYLLALGHRNIAFFSGTVNHTSTIEDRYHGFIRAFAKFGSGHNPAHFCDSISSVWALPMSIEKIMLDVEIAAKYLDAHPEISAAFAAEYSFAVIVNAAVKSLGRRVPEDFSILTFDSPPYITGIPPITHIRQNEYAIGKGAVETLHRIISGGGSAITDDVVIPAELIEGASTAPAK
jgi:DNA-binding LacI/PurR family transcriptional regulator